MHDDDDDDDGGGRWPIQPFSSSSLKQELNCVEKLRMNGNGWNEGPKKLAKYRNYCIFSLGTRLLELDGSRVIDEERLTAIRFWKQLRLL